MTRSPLISLVVVFLFFVAGCTPGKKQHNDVNTPPFIDRTNADQNITEKYWKLITLERQPVTMAEGQERESYFTLKEADNRLTGFAGCNDLMGTYQLEAGNRLRFPQVGTTRMACPGLAVDEAAVVEVFNLTDNYTISGDTLNLNVGRRARLAVFQAVYF